MRRILFLYINIILKNQYHSCAPLACIFHAVHKPAVISIPIAEIAHGIKLVFQM